MDTPAGGTSAPAVDATQAIAGLPGVDPQDPTVQAAVRNVSGGTKDGAQGDEQKEGGGK